MVSSRSGMRVPTSWWISIGSASRLLCAIICLAPVRLELGFFWGSSFNDGTTQTALDPLGRGAGSHPLRVQTMVGVH